MARDLTRTRTAYELFARLNGERKARQLSWADMQREVGISDILMRNLGNGTGSDETRRRVEAWLLSPTAPMAPQIGTHLATLNLFREPDGSVRITVSGASEDCRREFQRVLGPPAVGETRRLLDYVNSLVVEAAEHLK